MRNKNRLYLLIGRIALVVTLCLGGMSIAAGQQELAKGAPIPQTQIIRQAFWIASPVVLALYLFCDYKVTQKRRLACWIFWLVAVRRCHLSALRCTVKAFDYVK